MLVLHVEASGMWDRRDCPDSEGCTGNCDRLLSDEYSALRHATEAYWNVLAPPNYCGICYRNMEIIKYEESNRSNAPL